MNLPTAALIWSSEYDSDLRSSPEFGDGSWMGWKQRLLIVKELVWGQVWVRVLLAAWTVAASYDALNGVVSQILPGTWELPELGQLFMTGSALLPWWGWLLILQAILTASVIEFVVRHIAALDSDLEKKIGPLRDRIGAAEGNFGRFDTEMHTARVAAGHLGEEVGRVASEVVRLRQEWFYVESLPGQIQELQAPLAAIAEAHRLGGIPERLDVLSAQASEALRSLSGVEEIAAANKGGGAINSLGRLWSDRAMICEGFLGELEILALSECDQSIDTQSSPHYNANPFRKVPNDNRFSDEELKQEFRKLSDRVDHTLSQIGTCRQAVAQRLAKAQAVIREFK